MPTPFPLKEFCRRNRISVLLFYKNRNEMPRTFHVGARVLTRVRLQRLGVVRAKRSSVVDRQSPRLRSTLMDQTTSLVPQITLITKRGTPLMSKRIFLDGQGKLQSDASGCLMVEGTAGRASAATSYDLARLIANCRADQAIALGSLNMNSLIRSM